MESRRIQRIDIFYTGDYNADIDNIVLFQSHQTFFKPEEQEKNIPIGKCVLTDELELGVWSWSTDYSDYSVVADSEISVDGEVFESICIDLKDADVFETQFYSWSKYNEIVDFKTFEKIARSFVPYHTQSGTIL